MRLNISSITTKILIPWLLMIIILLVGTIAFKYYITQIDTQLRDHTNLYQQAVNLTADLILLTYERWSLALEYPVFKSPQTLKLFTHSEERIQSKINTLKSIFKQQHHLITQIGVAQGTTFLANFTLARNNFTKLYEDFIHAVDTYDIPPQVLFTQLAAKKQLIIATSNDLLNYHRTTLDLTIAYAETKRQYISAITYVFMAIMILAVVIFSIFQAFAIAVPLRQLTVAAQNIAEEKNTALLMIERNDEIGELSKALSEMVTKLHQSKQNIAYVYTQIENKVRQRTAELETANRDLESFSYSVSHDLRAPLRAIDGFIAILCEDYQDKLDAEGQRLFSIVSDNARKMGQLIDDILALSRAGRLEMEFTLLNMNSLVDEVWTSLEEQRNERVIEFYKADLPTIIADPRAVRQIWQNLISNAIKFTRNRTPAHIEISADSQNNKICYIIKDNGAGFNSEYATKLFVLFQRLHGVDEFEGTGVGLAIVKRFVKKHGGNITAEGILGVGATFSFCLPIINLDTTTPKTI